jgi:hypothetical protein
MPQAVDTLPDDPETLKAMLVAERVRSASFLPRRTQNLDAGCGHARRLLCRVSYRADLKTPPTRKLRSSSEPSPPARAHRRTISCAFPAATKSPRRRIGIRGKAGVSSSRARLAGGAMPARSRSISGASNPVSETSNPSAGKRSISSPSSIDRISRSQPACSAILLSAMT